MSRLRLLVALAASLSCFSVQAEKCRDGSSQPQPAWISGSAAMDGFYTGVGVSERGDLNLDQQRDIARQSALRELASSIEVFVRSELRLEESSTSEAGDSAQSQVDYRAVTEATASALLADTQVTDNWIDPRSCALWVRVAVAQAAVEQQQRKQATLAAQKLLYQHLSAARNADLEVAQRQRKISQAQALLARINFDLVDDGASRAQLSSEIASAKARLQRQRSAGANSQAQYAQGKAALDNARAQQGAARAQQFLSARKTLTSLASQVDFTDGAQAWSEQSLQALAQFAAEDGQICEAKTWYQQIAERSDQPDWQRRARRQAVKLKCNQQQQAAAAWRQVAYGRTARLRCQKNINQQSAYWDRSCQALADKLRQAGALDIKQERTASLAAVKSCLQGQCGNGLVVAALADGKVSQRDNPKNPLGVDYQYRGALAASIVDNGKLVFSDSFSGVGGWNPVSQDMAVEVIALQLMKRLDSKLASSWKAQ